MMVVSTIRRSVEINGSVPVIEMFKAIDQVDAAFHDFGFDEDGQPFVVLSFLDNESADFGAEYIRSL